MEQIIHKMHQHRRRSGTKHTGRIPHHRNHHENKRDVANTRALKAARQEEISEVNPLPETQQLSTEDISHAIREVVGDYDDTFQDVWVAVIEGHLNDLETIRQVANRLVRKNKQLFRENTIKQRYLEEATGDAITLGSSLQSDADGSFIFAQERYRGVSHRNRLNDHPMKRHWEEYRKLHPSFPHLRRPSISIRCDCPICGQDMGWFSQTELRASLRHYCYKCRKVAQSMKYPLIKIDKWELVEKIKYALTFGSSKTLEQALVLATNFAKEGNIEDTAMAAR